MATKSTTPKPAKAAAAKKPSAKTATLTVVADSAPGSEEGGVSEVRLVKAKELVDRVVAASGVNNRKNVRLAMEATLSELVKALQAGETPMVPGIGRWRAVNHREDDKGLYMTIKLRRGAAKPATEKDAKEPLVEGEEES